MDQRQRGIRSGRADCQRRQGHQVGRQNGQRQTVEGQDVVIDVVAQGQESKGVGESRAVVGEEEDELPAADAGLQRTRRQGWDRKWSDAATRTSGQSSEPQPGPGAGSSGANATKQTSSSGANVVNSSDVDIIGFCNDACKVVNVDIDVKKNWTTPKFRFDFVDTSIVGVDIGAGHKTEAFQPRKARPFLSQNVFCQTQRNVPAYCTDTAATST